MTISFTVLGRPQPAGSKRAFPVRKGGVLTGRVAVADSNPASRAWKQEVRAAAAAAKNGDGLLEGPLTLTLRFVLSRPKSHMGTGKNAGILKESAPKFPATRPDTTKLVRAVEDALSGQIWRDDAQIVAQFAMKVYGSPECCEVTVERMP